MQLDVGVDGRSGEATRDDFERLILRMAARPFASATER